MGGSGQTPLHLAICSKAIEDDMKDESLKEKSILSQLLQHKKIQIDIQDDKGRTPLHHVIMRNHSAIMKLLLDKNPNPNVQTI